MSFWQLEWALRNAWLNWNTNNDWNKKLHSPPFTFLLFFFSLPILWRLSPMSRVSISFFGSVGSNHENSFFRNEGLHIFFLNHPYFSRNLVQESLIYLFFYFVASHSFQYIPSLCRTPATTPQKVISAKITYNNVPTLWDFQTSTKTCFWIQWTSELFGVL